MAEKTIEIPVSLLMQIYERLEREKAFILANTLLNHIKKS